MIIKFSQLINSEKMKVTFTMLPTTFQAAPGATQATTSDGPAREFLTFRLGAVAYGIDILKVQEIRSYEAPTPIVGAPEFVAGVLNLRGVIVPIVDLRRRFGMTRVEFNHLTVTVILTLADRVVGAVVDSVSDVVALTSAQIRPMPTFNTGVDANFITGIGAPGRDDQDDMLVLLDIETMMTSSDMGLVAQTLQ
jgi:purine-binding chemotaxis protein CheW